MQDYSWLFTQKDKEAAQRVKPRLRRSRTNYFTSINIFPDQGWGDFFKVLIRHLSIFIFGYSNLMYVSGVSSKTHRYFVYGSYFLITIYLFAIISFSFKI